MNKICVFERFTRSQITMVVCLVWVTFRRYTGNCTVIVCGTFRVKGSSWFSLHLTQLQKDSSSKSMQFGKLSRRKVTPNKGY